jgi:hypothetical protein
MKKCFKCGIEKDISEFYVHKEMADGHLNKCKDCTKKDSFGRTKEEIEKRKERDRNRPNAKERVKKNCERLKNNEKARLENNKRKKEWYQKNKHKKNANLKVSRALFTGLLKRPIKCEKCNLEKKLEAHHEDYSKPLEVVWLCIECHNNRHKELNKIKRQTL